MFNITHSISSLRCREGLILTAALPPLTNGGLPECVQYNLRPHSNLTGQNVSLLWEASVFSKTLSRLVLAAYTPAGTYRRMSRLRVRLRLVPLDFLCDQWLV